MNSSIYLIIRDINNFIIENKNLLKNKVTLEKEVINLIKERYKNVSFYVSNKAINNEIQDTFFSSWPI